MIERIEIENLKSLKSVAMKTLPLNLLMGLNGMGKSSFIQSGEGVMLYIRMQLMRPSGLMLT